MLSSSPPPTSRRLPAPLGGFGWFYLLGGVLVLGVAWATAPEAVSTLRFARLGSLMLSTRWFMIWCAALFLVTGMLCYSVSPGSRVHRVSLGTNALALVCLVLVWASTGRRLEVLGILAQSVRLATPIALGALAGILCERSGVVNIAIEGMMLSAACLGFMIALYAANAWVGVLAAVAAGGMMAALHAILSIQWRVEQMISGIVINMLAVGLTGFIRRTVLLHNVREAPAVLPTWSLPVIADLPVLRQLFGRHQPLVYAMLLLVLVVHLLLFYTRWGLRTRAVGEHPRAADTVGINVFTVRYVNVILGGMIAGVGGGGALLFGFADALQIKLQIAGVNVPYQFLGMVPYLVTMIVLAGVIGRALPPAASGIPYDKNS